MRRLATIVACALTLAILPFAPTPANAAPGPGWTYYSSFPALWICQYVGNQLVAGHQAQNYECDAGTPGQLALWILPY